jgi:radical SAM protein with 4Fe4S-binding SPASM domain
MCLVRYRDVPNRREGSMPFETFERVVSELPDLRAITLQGLGEPLLAPDLFRMIEYATSRGITIGFNTNATLLTRARAERLIRARLDWLHVSIDGATADTYESIRDGSSFERVRRNLAGMVAAKAELRSDKPELSLIFVAMRRNVRELPVLVRLLAEWGVERLWVQNLSHSFGDTDPSGAYADIREFAARDALWADEDKERAARIFAETAELAAGLGLALRLPRLEEPPARPRPLGTPGCHWPFESAYVTHDGKVQPCCMVMGSDRVVLGDVGQERFGAVWTSEAYRTFRAGLTGEAPVPEVCAGCSLYRGVF